jgi:hypothetical protein
MWHYVLRMIALVGGILLPALTALNLSSAANRWTAFGLGLLIALSVALD